MTPSHAFYFLKNLFILYHNLISLSIFHSAKSIKRNIIFIVEISAIEKAPTLEDCEDNQDFLQTPLVFSLRLH